MESPSPILVAHLFPELRQHLLPLLHSLTPGEWLLPTAAKEWNVKDIALHLLGGDIGNLSRRRDGHIQNAHITSWNDLVTFINELNDSWVKATQRISPHLLCDLLEHTGPQMEAYFASLDPYAMGGAVSWAGPEPAPVWLDVAREYTERWHHQQQIRDATGRPGLYEKHLFAPVLDAFVRALPYSFRDVHAAEGTCVQLNVFGHVENHWALFRNAGTWKLFTGNCTNPIAEVTIAAEDAWKIFTRGIRDETAINKARIDGEFSLGVKILETVSVIA
jgi:uncharacterized protein (TIGR03083 family)